MDRAQFRAMFRAQPGALLWYHLWTAVLAANLIVPMRLARSEVGDSGRVGMALAVGVIWLIGGLAGARSRRTRFELLSGGLAVALSQVLPLLQMIAGAISLGLVTRLLGLEWGTDFGPIEGGISDAGSFLATLMTGGALIGTAWLVGAMFRVIRDNHRLYRRRAGGEAEAGGTT